MQRELLATVAGSRHALVIIGRGWRVMASCQWPIFKEYGTILHFNFISRVYYSRPLPHPQPTTPIVHFAHRFRQRRTTMDRSVSSSTPASTSVPPYSLPLPSGSGSWLYTTLAVLFTLLALEQSIYRYKKRHLPGATWTIPIIGKFADSVKPTMEGYMRQWYAGDLSAVSVFNMYVPSLISNSNMSLSLFFVQFHRHGLDQRVCAQDPQLSNLR